MNSESPEKAYRNQTVLVGKNDEINKLGYLKQDIKCGPLEERELPTLKKIDSDVKSIDIFSNENGLPRVASGLSECEDEKKRAQTFAKRAGAQEATQEDREYFKN